MTASRACGARRGRAIGLRRFECKRRPLRARWRAGPGAILLLLVIATACGPRDPAGATVRLIIEELSAQRFGTATARYRQNEELVLSAAAAPAWRRGMEHQDPTVREWSIDALARIGEPQDTARVVAALDDPFRNVQEAAARRLVELDTAVAAAAFIERLYADDPLTLTIAAQGLAQLGDPTGTEPLIARFRDEQLDAAVRRILAQSLAGLGDARAVAPLAAVAGDPAADLALRRDAAEALTTFEGEGATEALRGLLGADDAYVQEVARRAIAVRRR